MPPQMGITWLVMYGHMSEARNTQACATSSAVPGPGVHQFLGHFGGHLGLDEAGADDVDAYVAGGELFGAALAEAYDAGLGGSIVGLVVVARDADDGADVDDGAVSLTPHRGLDGLGHAEYRSEVGVHHAVELFLGHALDGGVVGDAGVVDEDVDLAKIGQHLLDEVLCLLVVGHVAGIAFRRDAEGEEFLFDGNHFLVMCAAAEGHVAAFLGKAKCDGVADAAGGTGDDGGLSL